MPAHGVGYVTLRHTLLWVIEPSDLHILAQISARVLEWVFFAFPHSLYPCDTTCPAEVERQCVDCRFHFLLNIVNLCEFHGFAVLSNSLK